MLRPLIYLHEWWREGLPVGPMLLLMLLLLLVVHCAALENLLLCQHVGREGGNGGGAHQAGHVGPGRSVNWATFHLSNLENKFNKFAFLNYIHYSHAFSPRN